MRSLRRSELILGRFSFQRYSPMVHTVFCPEDNCR